MKQESRITSSSSIISRRKVKSSWSISRSVLEHKQNNWKNYKKNKKKIKKLNSSTENEQTSQDTHQHPSEGVKLVK